MKPFAKKMWNKSWTVFFVSFAGHWLKPFLHFVFCFATKKTSPYYSRSIRNSVDPIFNWIFLGDGQHKKESCIINPHPHIGKIQFSFFSCLEPRFCLEPKYSMYGCMVYPPTWKPLKSSIHVDKYTSSPIECLGERGEIGMTLPSFSGGKRHLRSIFQRSEKLYPTNLWHEEEACAHAHLKHRETHGRCEFNQV